MLSVISRRGPIPSDRRDTVALLDHSCGPGRVLAQAPVTSSGPISVGEPADGDGGTACERGTICDRCGACGGGGDGSRHWGGYRGEERESQYSGGESRGGAGRDGSTASTNACRHGENPSGACEVNCRVRAERCPATSCWCGYTPRSKRLLRPRDLGPPLLPQRCGWRTPRIKSGGRTRRSDRGAYGRWADVLNAGQTLAGCGRMLEAGPRLDA